MKIEYFVLSQIKEIKNKFPEIENNIKLFTYLESVLKITYLEGSIRATKENLEIFCSKRG